MISAQLVGSALGQDPDQVAELQREINFYLTLKMGLGDDLIDVDGIAGFETWGAIHAIFVHFGLVSNLDPLVGPPPTVADLRTGIDDLLVAARFMSQNTRDVFQPTPQVRALVLELPQKSNAVVIGGILVGVVALAGIGYLAMRNA